MAQVGDLIPLFKKEPYFRPADWLPLPKLTSEDQKIVGLHAVWPHDSNFVAFVCEGAYTVDWGDGSSPQNYASGVAAYHVFDYDDLEGTECSRGYRQAIVTITPQSGQNLTSANFAVKHNQAGLADGYSTGWLDVKAVGANIAAFLFGSPMLLVVNAMLEIFEFIGSNVIVNFAGMFAGCYSLQSIPQLDTSSGTNFSGMFFSCPSLQSIPQLDTSSSSGEIFIAMFAGCVSLQSIPQLDTSSGTNFSGMFNGCYSLQSIPQLDTSSGTNFTNMFMQCPSLSTAALLGTSTNISYQGCRLSRQALVDIFNGLATVTSATITITGNWGAADLSASDRDIATNKGWTIAG